MGASGYAVELWEESTPHNAQRFTRPAPAEAVGTTLEICVGGLSPGRYNVRVRSVLPCGCESSPSPVAPFTVPMTQQQICASNDFRTHHNYLYPPAVATGFGGPWAEHSPATEVPMAASLSCQSDNPHHIIDDQLLPMLSTLSPSGTGHQVQKSGLCLDALILN